MTLRSTVIGAAWLLLAACSGDDAGVAGGTGTGSTGSSGAPAVTEGSGATNGSSTGAAADSDSDSAGSTSLATTGGPGVDSTGSEGGSESTGGGERGCADRWPQWNDGTDCGREPLQVHQVSDDTFIVRQSLCTNFEGPFVYLLFGTERVLLLDTGAGGVELATAVQSIIDTWLAARGIATVELVVVNSHAHGDHTQGNAMFQGLPNTVVVGVGQASVSDFFGLGDWPNQSGEYDLGERLLDIIPIPGHEFSHIAIYDHGEGWLLTGDTLYPGRLYISNFSAYMDSINRLVEHVEDLEVCNVMGTHIEMTNVAGVDFPFGADAHPDEHPLPLTVDHLTELRDAVEAMAGAPVIEVHDDFIIYPL